MSLKLTSTRGDTLAAVMVLVDPNVELYRYIRFIGVLLVPRVRVPLIVCVPPTVKNLIPGDEVGDATLKLLNVLVPVMVVVPGDVLVKLKS